MTIYKNCKASCFFAQLLFVTFVVLFLFNINTIYVIFTTSVDTFRFSNRTVF